MRYHLAVEDMEPNHYVAYALELPGCFSSARTEAEAVGNASAMIAAHFEWRASRGRPSPWAGEPIDTEVAEVFRSFPSQEDPEYVVNGFFEDDRRSVTAGEAEEGLWLLDQTRRDLMEVVSKLGADEFARPYSRVECESPAGILNHIAIAEWWYFDRLDFSPPREGLPDSPLAKLEAVRASTRAQLPKLVGETRVVTLVDERWSARKVLRRALWHERDHMRQIASFAIV